MRIKIALVLMSAIFMFGIAVFISHVYGSLNFEIVIDLFSAFSFFGSVLFLYEAKTVLHKWFLAVPLCISLFVLVIVNFWIILSGKEFLQDPISSAEKLMITLMMLLPLFSALAFLSLLRHPDSMKANIAVRYGTNILSLAISCVLSFVLMPFLRYIPELTHSSATLDVVAIYWLFGMPIIGICFLLNAITYRNPGNVTAT